jgi:hypothetical protein
MQRLVMAGLSEFDIREGENISHTYTASKAALGSTHIPTDMVPTSREQAAHFTPSLTLSPSGTQGKMGGPTPPPTFLHAACCNI